MSVDCGRSACMMLLTSWVQVLTKVKEWLTYHYHKWADVNRLSCAQAHTGDLRQHMTFAHIMVPTCLKKDKTHALGSKSYYQSQTFMVL